MPKNSYKFWKQLYQDRLYTKSYNEFTKQFSDPAKAERLYTMLYADKYYSRTIDDFKKQFFSPTIGEETGERLISIQDTRKKDSVTGEPIKEESKLHADIDSALAEHIVKKAREYDIDPYTALAIAYQETGFKHEYSDNPFNLLAGERLNPETADQDIIDLSMQTLIDKRKIAEKLGKKTDEEIIQAWNGYGKIGSGSFGGKVKRIYGIDVSKNPIDMSKNPVYGKRVTDIRDNILKKNPDIVKLINEIQEQTRNNLDIDSILLANKNIPFVKKILNKDTTSIQIPGVEGRSTHYMEQSDNYMYPTVQEVNGKLKYLGKDAFKNAIKTGNYIKFKNEQEAIYASEHYKDSKIWEEYEK